MGQTAPAAEQVEPRLGRCLQQRLVDGGAPAHDRIDAAADKTEVPAPEPAPRRTKGTQNKDQQGKPGQSCLSLLDSIYSLKRQALELGYLQLGNAVEVEVPL